MAALDAGAEQERGAVDLWRYFDSESGDLDVVIAQAEGVISAQANISPASAVIALDDECRGHRQTRHAVAVQVTERRLRFDRPCDG